MSEKESYSIPTSLFTISTILLAATNRDALKGTPPTADAAAGKVEHVAPDELQQILTKLNNYASSDKNMKKAFAAIDNAIQSSNSLNDINNALLQCGIIIQPDIISIDIDTKARPAITGTTLGPHQLQLFLDKLYALDKNSKIIEGVLEAIKNAFTTITNENEVKTYLRDDHGITIDNNTISIELA
jgi:hypothetical protein